MLYALVFGLFTFCLAQRPNLVLVNPVIRFIGKVSYSAYFWHFAVIAVSVRVGVDLSGLAHQDIYFIFVFMAIATLSIAGGAVTYRCIEVPMIKIGATLLRAMSNAKGPLEAQPLRAG
jgi:peptidoglycan/LPS O-acetylase OafA/YrhL